MTPEHETLPAELSAIWVEKASLGGKSNERLCTVAGTNELAGLLATEIEEAEEAFSFHSRGRFSAGPGADSRLGFSA
jgi:hypothetical protein